METEHDGIRAIARRAAGRVRAAGGSPLAPTPGVHVQVRSVTGPGGGDQANARRALVEADCLSRLADGEVLTVPEGAQVTPLAREEAFRRDIELIPAKPSYDALTGSPVNSGSARVSQSVRTVAVGSDHGGFSLKGEVLGFLADLGFPSRDMGTGSDAPCDYPDFAAAVAREVSEGRAQFGIVIDGAGIGSAMAAGKVSGVLAANCWSQASAFNARTHNHANLLTLGAGHLDSALAREIVETFLKTPTGPGRHANRVKKIQALDLPRPSIGHLSR
ncbi:MAG: RpiB/LacA/LacB family sugar-phosphate isomerase [Planctomycetota bacterium]|nr:RpiB/LacA/LacB family sugar-phosphate isomerase [Planctomycetota bacterium]